MFRVYINDGGGLGESEVTRYVSPGSIRISKSLNLPTTCEISLIGFDSNFVLPVPRSYIRIYSSKYQRTLFTGLLTVDPSRNFQGLGRCIPGTRFQIYEYNLSYTSDEYLLNIKSVDYIPAFVNQTQGQILKNLADILAPNYYDTSMVADGDLVPYLEYDPTKTWSDYAKQFCDASRYRYSCQDRQIRFQPYGDGKLGIEYDEDAGESTFDPSGLSTAALTTQVVNDITVIGQQEAGNNHEDYFIGDGFTGAFPLKHQVYGLSSSFSGSSVLLKDQWSQGTLNNQNWVVQDAAGEFNYVNGGLNIISGLSLDYGISYIYAKNAVELAGGVIFQHGEIQINDTCTGLIGGIYDDTTLSTSGCEAAFLLTPSQAVNVTASGASGIYIQPYRQGSVVDQSFTVLSKVNKTYTLYTKVAAPVPARYLQVFRSISGYQYGGYSTVPTVSGSITWTVLETDIFSGEQTYYHFTKSNITLPDTAVYGLINNNELNISLSSTQVWTPPPGSLNIKCEIGSGLLAPIYISGNVQYTGAFVTPSGGHLPIQTGGNDPASSKGFGPEQQFDMGSGIGSQSAEIDSGSLTSTLNFYNNDIPGVGTRIRLQTWESQAAMSRMRDSTSATHESAVVGDDGIRATVMTNLNPLPRTSEDCDNAAQAILKDRVSTFYQGTYNCSYQFFDNSTGDVEFYPTCGRYLKVNSPQRNIFKQSFLVSSLTITVTEMAGEILEYSISFGPDLYLEKLLAALRPNPTTTVLQPIDTSVQLTPQQLSKLGSYYLPDVAHSTLNGNVSGTQIQLWLRDALPINAMYEIRNADVGTWGKNDSTLITRCYFNQLVTLPRTSYDQSWYIRMVSGAYIPDGGSNAAFNPNAIAQSRRTKVIRVMYPRTPSAPMLLTKDTAFVQMDFQGDTRNVEGLEIRLSDDSTVVYQGIVGSRYDLGIDMDKLRNQLSPGESGLTGLGQYLVNPFPASGREFKARFFNLMWEYGPAVDVQMPQFDAPTISEAYRWGSSLQIAIALTSVNDLNRTDLESTIMQICSDNTFAGTGSVFIQSEHTGNPGFMTVNVPVTGDLYARAAFVDKVSMGTWSNLLHIPQGNLIASDYLASQGSVPPIITNNSSGGLFSWSTTASSITMMNQAFGILYPNGVTESIPAATGVYTQTLTLVPLNPSTAYGFYPYMDGPTKGPGNNSLQFNGPWANTFFPLELSVMYQDGHLPLASGPLVVQTAASGGGTGGGGGGGTGGGTSCGTLPSVIEMFDGTSICLRDLKVGMVVKSPEGKPSAVKRTILLRQKTMKYRTESGCTSRTSYTHTLKMDDEWYTLEELVGLAEEGEEVYIETVKSKRDKLVEWKRSPDDWILRIELESIDGSECDHLYILDGCITHNFIVKGQS